MTTETDHRPSLALVAHAVHARGGMERTFYELVRRASARYRVVVVARELAPELRSLVEWRRVPVPSRPFPLRFAVFFVLAAVRLARTRADLVHTMGAIVPNRIDVACITYCHAGFRQATGGRAYRESPVDRRLNFALMHFLAVAAERWCYRAGRARRLAAISPGVAREVRQHYPSVPVTITPCGVDIERFQPDGETRRRARAARGVTDDQALALFVGTDWDRKGLAVAIEGLAVARDAGADLRLWVSGRGDEGRFGGLAEELGVADRLSFLGFPPDVERLYQAADIFVLPTQYETFCLAAYEAAASELPIVAPRVSGIEELVGDDECGVLVERNGLSVGTALAGLAADPERRRRMGRAGRRRSRDYTWDRSAQAVLEVYDGLLSEARPARRRGEARGSAPIGPRR